jgi:hypothetical protein
VYIDVRLKLAQNEKPPAAFAGGGLNAAVAKSFSSGSDSRAHVVAANSNHGNGNSAADSGGNLCVGAGKLHNDT